ncbi:MAG: GNAT family N-acetyltransferase [bacterium]|nr:GNAT family N-acetyltransferase [bacterium]
MNAPSNIVQILSNDQLREIFYQGQLDKLYQQCFSEPPYCEYFSPGKVWEIMTSYIKHGVFFISHDQAGQATGFVASIPLKDEPEVLALAKPFGFNEEEDWYAADLGVAKSARRQGLGSRLSLTMVDNTPAKHILLRTSKLNLASRQLNEAVGFRLVPGLTQVVRQERQNGKTEDDERIFLVYDKK